MVELGSERDAIVDMARNFARDRMMADASVWDDEHIFPIDVLREAAELGMAGIYVPEECGGSGLGRLDAALIFEELSAACPSTAAYLSIHNMVAWMIATFGNDEQRQRFLPDLLSMRRVASYCLTEPGSGSDAASLKTRAVHDGGAYRVNGSKAFISGGGASDLYLVMCRTGADGPKGISALLMEGGSDGLSYGAQEKKLGWHSQPTAALMFDDCMVPSTNLLGQEGQGFRFAMAGLDGGRINIAACSLGGARECLDRARHYTSERQQFGKPLAANQAVQFHLADMATSLEASRLMVHRAATALDDRDADATMRCAMAKRFATDTCFDIVNQALQLHGGYGYLQDYGIERYLRDLRVHQILEGANDIMRMIIARDLLKDQS